MKPIIKHILFLIVCCFFILSHAQEPFDIPTVDYEKIKVIDYSSQFGFRTSSKMEDLSKVDSSDFSFFLNKV